MSKDQDLQFVQSVKEVFDSVFKEYGFEFQNDAIWNGKGEYTVKASKTDLELIYYLGLTPTFYLFSLGINLLGQLAEKATLNKHYHSIGVTAIAKCLDKDYKYSPSRIQTKEELIEALKKEKVDLLKYCQGVLSGDVSTWSEVVNCLEEQRKRSGYKIHGRD